MKTMRSVFFLEAPIAWCSDDTLKRPFCQSSQVYIVEDCSWKIFIGLSYSVARGVVSQVHSCEVKAPLVCNANEFLQGTSFQQISQLYGALLALAWEHFSKENCSLRIALMTFAGGPCSRAEDEGHGRRCCHCIPWCTPSRCIEVVCVLESRT